MPDPNHHGRKRPREEHTTTDAITTEVIRSLETQLKSSTARVAELERQLAEQHERTFFVSRYVEACTQIRRLEQALRASAERTRQLSAENERLIERAWRTEKLMNQLVPLEEEGDVFDRMDKSLTDIERTFRPIKALSLRVAAVQESQISRAYLTFREEKLAGDLSVMTARYARVLTKLQDTHARLRQKDTTFLRSFGINAPEPAVAPKRKPQGASTQKEATGDARKRHKGDSMSFTSPRVDQLPSGHSNAFQFWKS